MLAQGSRPMDRARCSGISMLAPTLRRGLILAVVQLAGLVCLPESIFAQGPIEASGRIATSARGADLFPGATSGADLFNPSAFPAFPGSGSGIRAFGQSLTPSTAVPRDLVLKPVAWGRWLQEPSQRWMGTAKFGGSATGSIGFSGFGRQKGGGFDQFTGRGLGATQRRFPPLFPGTSVLPSNQSGGTAPGTLPRFDARVASSFTSPFNSAAGAFRLSSREMFGDSRNTRGGNFGTGSGSATFGTSNLGNGMFLSAGTSFGSRSAAGAVAGGPKRSGPSVGLRLTF